MATSSSRSSRDSDQSGEAGFRAVLVVRILTVLNDNLARWLVIGLGKRAAAAVGTTPAAVLTIGTVVYVLPFILLAWLSGWLGDRFAKRSVVVVAKAAEILIAVITAGIAAWGAVSGAEVAGLPLGLWLLLGTTGLFAVQTTLLNPSLLGTIPETVPVGRLSSANGVFAMVSLAATLVGMAAGNFLADRTWLAARPPDAERSLPDWLAAVPFGHAIPAATALLSVAVVGWLVSLRLPKIPAANPLADPPFNVIRTTVADLRRLFAAPRLAAASAGIVYFWALAAVTQLNVDQLAFESGATTQSEVVPLLIALVSGIGVGSLIAGRLSKRGIDPGSKVDLGFVPLGGFVMMLACFALAISGTEVFVDGAATWRVVFPVFWLAMLGIGAGLFDVPLEASLQEQSPPNRLASVLASTNLMVFTGMLLSSVAYYALRVPVGTGELARPLLSARGIFALFGLLSLLATSVAIFAAPRATLRIVVASLVHLRYRFRVRDDDLVPPDGPLVVIANHISWLDGFVTVLSCPRPIRMVVFGPNIRGRFLRMLSDQWRFILFDPKPKSIARALSSIQEGLAEGDCIGIFCEGGISRTGQILPFKRGLDWIFSRIEAPLAPLAIDGMWGSVLSYAEGQSLSKWPRTLARRRLTLSYGPPLPAGTPAAVARIALQEVLASAVRRRMVATRQAAREIDRWSRRQAGRIVAIDASGRRLNGRQWRDLAGASAAAANEMTPDWAAMAVTAEAFDGGCVLRRTDSLVSSLGPDDPLGGALGRWAGPLLGVHAVHVAADVGSDELRSALAIGPATIWLATAEQVAALARGPARPLPATLVAVVVPIASPAALRDVEPTAAAFRDAYGLELSLAYTPAGSAGLVAMNTPPLRNVAAHEVTFKSGSLGRVLNGTAFWPQERLRATLGLPEPLTDRPLQPDAPLAVGGGFIRPRQSAADSLVAWPLPVELSLDDDAFLTVDAGDR